MTHNIKLATAVAASVLGVAVTGAVAFAAFDPGGLAPAAAVVDTSASPVQAERQDPRDRIKDVLDGLVQKGTITAAQEDAIVAALKAAAPDKDKHPAAEVAMDLLKVSSGYLGLSKDQLRDQLKAGKSLGQIADATGGKSRSGLIAFDVQQLSAQIDKMLADGKITKDQADKLKAHLTERVTKFVDHTFTGPKPKK